MPSTAGEVRHADGRGKRDHRDNGRNAHGTQLVHAELGHVAAQDNARNDRIQQHVGQIAAALFGYHAAAGKKQAEHHQKKHDDRLLKQNLSNHKGNFPVLS